MYTPYSPLESSELTDLYGYEDNKTNETAEAVEFEIKPLNIAKGLALSCCAFCAFLGNLLVIVAVASTKRLQTITNLFVVSLALADMAVSVLVLPLSILLEITERWIFDQIVCDIWISSDVMLCTASILNLCAISVDRYLAITRPLKYAATRSKRTATLMILCAWCLSFIITAPPILGWRESDRGVQAGTCGLTKNPGYIVFSALGSFFLPAAVMITIYIRIFYVAHRREKTFSTFRQQSCGSINSRQEKTSRSLSGVTKLSTSDAGTSIAEEDVNNCNVHSGCKFKFGQETQRVPLISQQQVSTDEKPEWQTAEDMDAGDADADADAEPDAPPLPSNGTSVFSTVLQRLKHRAPWRSASNEHNRLGVMLEHAQSASAAELDAELDVDDCSTPRTVGQQKLVKFDDSHRCNSRKLVRNANRHSSLADSNVDLDADGDIDGYDDVGSLPKPKTSAISRTSPESSGTVSRASSLRKMPRRSPAANAGRDRDADADRTTLHRDSVDTRYASEPSSVNGEALVNVMRRSESKRLDRTVSARLRSRLESQAMRERRKEKAILRSENKTAQTLAIVMGCFVISWSPFFLVYLIKPFCGCAVPDAIDALITWLGYCNSLCNPFIYAFYNKDFLNAFVRIIRQLLCLPPKKPQNNCRRSRKSNNSINSRSE